MQRRGILRLKSCADLRIVRQRREFEPIEERPDVKPCPADDEGHTPARADPRKCGAAVPLVAKDVVTLARIDDVDEVMGNASALLDRRLRRSDVHPAIDLTRIG